MLSLSRRSSCDGIHGHAVVHMVWRRVDRDADGDGDAGLVHEILNVLVAQWLGRLYDFVEVGILDKGDSGCKEGYRLGCDVGWHYGSFNAVCLR